MTEADPIHIARRFLAALDDAEWQIAASLVDEDDLKEWYAEKTRDRTYKGRPVTAEDILAHDPEMPIEAAMYSAEKAQADLARRGSSLHGDFGHIDTVEELRAVTPRTALALFLQMLDPAERYAFETGKSKPDLGTRRAPVGCVRPRQRIAYVVYEIVAGNEQTVADLPCLLLLRYTKPNWYVRLRADPFQHVGYHLIGTVDDEHQD